MGAVERAIQTLKNVNIANSEEEIGFKESVSRALRVMPFSLYSGLKVSPFEIHHGRKRTTEKTNILKDNTSYLCDWKTMKVPIPPKQIPIHVARNEKGEVTDHVIMAKKRKFPCSSSHKSPKRKPIRPVSGNFQYLYTFLEKRNHKKSLEGMYKEQQRNTIDGTEHTIRTTDKKILHRN